MQPLKPNNLKLEFISSISEIDKAEFESLKLTDYPFIQYDFLNSLEQSQCVAINAGWQPKHLAAYENDRLVAFMPLYLKTHSYGEYVFDFQWADAYHQSGIAYYPKLLCAIPFTPCIGPRTIIAHGHEEPMRRSMINAVVAEAKRINVSSFHLLFPDEHWSSSDLHLDQNLMERIGVQFHWHNDGYANFDEFLKRCKMKQRKNIRRERRMVAESLTNIRVIEGADISQQLWNDFFYFYQLTYTKKSGNVGYLNQSFFNSLGKTMPSKIVMMVAEQDNQTIATSLFFKDSTTLYGRYWGTTVEVEYLHFELCYYQGIDYCIKNGLKHFDAGAQGEHKIQRGFKPIETYSYHLIINQRFEKAISDFLLMETPHIKNSISQLAKKLPYKP